MKILLVLIKRERSLLPLLPNLLFKLRAQGLKDVKVVAREQEKVIAPSDSDAGPPIDLSILEQRQQARVSSTPAASLVSPPAPYILALIHGR